MVRQDDIIRQDDMIRQNDIVHQVRQPRQAKPRLKSLANSLSHLKMTIEDYAIFFIYCG
ncbi:MAG: hypothetical protein F6K54_13610 [Okeania sp. SIO3B5]|uniref:hypothetical protein n=1 Tax=Okeania sp. SIO3B5 TaxID=2607811 RepID=UPI001400626E|nr:hypothetical protein [Okeania sp. SIO3B5]NEO54022.1 hypothetical protein [Okeania sp. SIO3B5]